MKIIKAKLEDVGKIHNLIHKYAREGLMLYRPTREIEHKIRDYFVCKEKNSVIGCIGLTIWNKNAAEIYGLAVDKNHTDKGIGSMLVKKCIQEARDLGVKSVFALTSRKELFIKLGFKKITARELPRIMFTTKTVDSDKAYGIKLTK